MKKQEIPLMFCFDNNYVIPAAVAFYSLLEHCNRDYYYKLYILHTDISELNQKKLIENVKQFSDFSELIFVNMKNKFEDLWLTIKTKGHFSKEVMYKILVASIFPIYEKIIVSDVDVVFLDDISKSYFDLDCNEDYYLAGVKMIGKMKWYLDQLEKQFTKEEIEMLSGFCGGYIVFNLKKLREDKMEEKFVKCFENEGYRINQMEQDVLNLCCYPKTKRLPLKYIACSYMWDIYLTEEDKKTDIYYSKEEIEDAMSNTVQLHFATSNKPWKNVDCTKSEVWFKYLLKTNFATEYLKKLPNMIEIPKERIELIKSEEKNQMYNEIVQDITRQVEKNNTIKAKVDRRLGKYKLFRIIKYILKNPLFLFKVSFYKKIINRFDKQDFSLIIIDDVFPSMSSPFRYEEYMEYLKELKSVYAFTTGLSLSALKDKRTIKEVIEKFENENPEFKNKVLMLSRENEEKLQTIRNKIAIVTFIQNLQNSKFDNIDLLERNKIPYIFTLYPGGGFKLNDEECDKKIKRACSSKYFTKVIVTQKNVYDYLIEKNFCKKENIEFIYGIVTPKQILNNDIKEKKYYKKDKKNFDVCFVAHKYSEKGIDKGYDLFIESAKKLTKKYHNIKFHVIGGFNEKDIDISDLKGNINFYGIKPSNWLHEFYKNMDIIVSPNKPFILSEGSFDGFPTGSCTEAMISGVALLCTDELKLNVKFKDKKDLIIIKPESSDIVKKIEELYNNPDKIIKIAKNGRKKASKLYSINKQLKTRINLIKKSAKKIYGY